MDLHAPGLVNAVVRLEPMTEQHRDLLRASGAIEYMWLSMPAIQRGAGFDAYYDYMLRCARDDEAYAFAVFLAATGQFIGVTAFLQPSKMHRRVLISYTWLDESIRGRGVYRAVQHLMIKRALEWGARRIGWNVEARNDRAVKAIENLGAQREGVLRNYSRFADGTWVDIALLSMMREEAKDAVKRLDMEVATSAA